MKSELHYTLIKSPAEFEQHRDIWNRLHTVHQQLRPALQDLTEYVERIRLMLREGAYYLWVKNPAEEIVSIAIFRMHHNTYQNKLCFLDDLIVNEQIRASGIGKQVLSYIEDFARENACDHLSLDSGTFRTRAHKFYFMNNYVADCFHFSKKL